MRWAALRRVVLGSRCLMFPAICTIPSIIIPLWRKRAQHELAYTFRFVACLPG